MPPSTPTTHSSSVAARRGPTGTGSLAECLDAAARRHFVGRAGELATFSTLLALSPTSPRLLWLHGPGGIGKTALLSAFAQRATAEGWDVVCVDGGFADPTTSVGPQGAGDTPTALLIDGYSASETQEEWLRRAVLPSLAASTVVVVGSRQPPSADWTGDAGWGPLLRRCPLRNLAPEESADYLRRRGVPDARIPEVLGFTHGHPLGLSLVADLFALGDAGGPPAVDAPDVVAALLQRLVTRVPSDAHRQALEVCAHARVTTETLLAEVLGEDDAAELFAWLRGLSFVELGADGLFPHELARDVLESDLRWRRPDRFAALHRAVRRPTVRLLQEASGPAQQRAFTDLLFLHRHNPVMRPLYGWSALGIGRIGPAAPVDHEQLVGLVEEQLGPRSAGIARHWLAAQPGSFAVFRNAEGVLTGFTCVLVLDRFDDDAADPALSAVADAVRAQGPLRTGDRVGFCRFAVSASGPTHDDLAEVWEYVSTVNVGHWLSTSRLAWSFIGLPSGGPWSSFFPHIRFHEITGAAFRLNGVAHVVYGHDWRAEPATAWLDAMEARELSTTADDDEKQPTAPPLLVLAEQEFADAVRAALRQLRDPTALATNPLTRSRLVVEAAGPPAETLNALVLEAAATLRRRPRDERLHRAVDRTYLRPAATQERAAELLGLPFSTYRSHLVAGVARITQLLWERELHGSPDGSAEN